MPYLSELERGRKEASSEILAAAGRALGLNLADLLARAYTELAEAQSEHTLTSLGDLGTRHTGASVVTEGIVNLAA